MLMSAASLGVWLSPVYDTVPWNHKFSFSINTPITTQIKPFSILYRY
ncbi:hypothetical protein HanPSC8_Chr02g0063341 [Helianthus annuus]|nr:hypothetical protein HanPSC8_Chr02g0063341 [Helianthus annuus]